MRRTLTWCLVLAAVAAAANEPPLARFADQRVIDALSALQRAGLPIVFSSALVTPGMVVEEEPKGDDPRDVLDQILAPHGLAARESPGGQLVVVRATDGGHSPPTGRVSGRVVIEADPVLLRGVIVWVVGTDLLAPVSLEGRFALDGVPAGEVTLEAAAPGLLPQRLEGVRVISGETATVRFQLVPASVFLSEIVVTPSHFRILEEQPEVRQFLSREEVARMPHIADDLYRAVKRLPGASGGDISATFNVRGGSPDEVLVLLDGLELYEPFHLKDFQNVFSTVDAEAVGGVDFLTGGFPVEYGDRMSGVMDIAVATPDGPTRTAVGVGTLNARLLSQGGFNAQRGHWLVSARAWYPDALLESSGSIVENVLTDYYDLLAKVEHRVGDRSSLAADLLFAADDLGYHAADEESSEDVTARYRSLHVWLNLRTDWSEALRSQTVVSAGRVDRRRVGGEVDLEDGTLDVSDDRTFDFVGFKQDWSLEIADRHLFKGGVDFKHQEAVYDYGRRAVLPDDGDPAVEETILTPAPRGEAYGLYLADRIRLGERLVAELGLRWDTQSWLDDEQLSPRVNVRYALGPWTAVRAAWGRFNQSQRLNELQVEDGVSNLYPAQRAQHWLVSLDHRFRQGMALRLEAYHKSFDRLRPRYENLFNPLELFPEARPDRVRVPAAEGRAQGVELLLKQEAGDAVSWWLAYALGRAEDSIDGEWVPRSWDQRHSLSAGLNLTLPRRWNLNLAGTYHSGFPTTAVTGEVVGWDGDEPEVELSWGPRNGERYPDYLRLDLRASKGWSVAFGDLTLILEVINFTNRRNVCCVEDLVPIVQDDGSVEVRREERTWLPIIPSLGVRWAF